MCCSAQLLWWDESCFLISFQVDKLLIQCWLETSFSRAGLFPRIPAASFGIGRNIQDVLSTISEEKPLPGCYFFFFCRQHLSPFPGSGCESLISLCLRQTLTQNFYHANLPVSTLEPLNQRMSPSSVFKCCFRNTGMPFGPALVLPELWSFAQKT